MRVAHLVLGLCTFAAACSSGSPGKSICDNTVPPPAACMTQCDPSPSAANTCPSGYHCAADGFCDARCTPGGNECGDGYICTADGRCKGEDDCTGIECNITDCQKQGKPETTIKGTVYAPNGTLPLYGITVYVPNVTPLPAMPEGAQCSRCSDDLPGQPLARATTDENGNFVLSGNVPDGDVPLVLVSGKWRRQIMVPGVAECAETTAPATETRLPRNKTEGDIPKIALTTGDADSLECLLKKLGVDDAEISNGTGSGRFHFYRGDGVSGFKNGWAGGAGDLTAANALWDDVNKLKNYDIVILSCEGSQQGSAGSSMKDQTDLNAMKAYADLGGRVFTSHWHNIWIGGGFAGGGGNPVIADWQAVATWQSRGDPGDTIDLIDETSNPKGTAFANWMASAGVMGSTVRGQIPVTEGKITVNTLDTTKAERWTYLQQNDGGYPQNFQFTTPIDKPIAERCGKVVFSDMHVSGGPINLGSARYPDTCNGGVSPSSMTPQEKALAFMIFDLSSCVGVLF